MKYGKMSLPTLKSPQKPAKCRNCYVFLTEWGSGGRGFISIARGGNLDGVAFAGAHALPPDPAVPLGARPRTSRARLNKHPDLPCPRDSASARAVSVTEPAHTHGILTPVPTGGTMLPEPRSPPSAPVWNCTTANVAHSGVVSTRTAPRPQFHAAQSPRRDRGGRQKKTPTPAELIF
jgi:hypothetical protein